MDSLTIGSAASVVHVVHVVGLLAELKVIGINTQAVVAFMADYVPARDG